MNKHVAVLTGAAAIFAIAALTPTGASAGASASAPSKYANQPHSNQIRADRQNIPISEYSSSARRESRKH